jgi:uncharacterized membrane protein YsdA (DUF1294 family)
MEPTGRNRGSKVGAGVTDSVVAEPGMFLMIAAVYVSMSGIAFAVVAYDKLAARLARRRVAENRLHLLSVLGGWPGALLAHRVFRHKTQKQSFRALFAVAVLVNGLGLTGLLWLMH